MFIRHRLWVGSLGMMAGLWDCGEVELTTEGTEEHRGLWTVKVHLVHCAGIELAGEGARATLFD